MKSNKIVIVAILIVALLGAGLTGALSRSVRERVTWGENGRPPQAGRASLAQMNSFALALLLGGLRGPLVMFLWTSSETAKNDRNLEDVDTQIEWIRMLQPEFDTVHIFQIWNKAYNHSVQMANPSNKYTTILDALEYARSVDRERPQNINILTAIGQTYFDKLGNSSEKAYYRRRVREETQQHDVKGKLTREDPEFKPLEHEICLGAEGRIVSAKKQDLQYLLKYEPFPQGISPFAIAFNYYKWSQVLQSEKGQRHAQMSDLVIDSRPALALKNWAADEWERGRRFEILAYGRKTPIERTPMEAVTADLSPGAAPELPDDIGRALYCYELTARLGDDAMVEYERHLKSYLVNESTYLSHIDEIRAMQQLVRADAAFLGKNVSTAEDRAVVAGLYHKAKILYARMILKYYVDDQVINTLKPQYTSPMQRADIDRRTFAKSLSDIDVLRAFDLALQLSQALPFDTQAEDRSEYLGNFMRIDARLKSLESAAAPQ